MKDFVNNSILKRIFTKKLKDKLQSNCKTQPTLNPTFKC